MPENNPMNDVDKRILDAMEKDGRISTAALADQIELSRPAVGERLKKLEDQGIIRGYTAVLDPKAIGKEITAFIQLRMPEACREECEAYLLSQAEIPDVLEIHSIAGEDCFMVKVRAESIAALNKLVHEFQRPPFSMTTRTTIVLETCFEKVGGIVIKKEPTGSA